MSDISLLPRSPKIFHGRDLELRHLLSTLIAENSSRIAILGPGGIDKSSLALAALYNQEVATKFQSERISSHANGLSVLEISLQHYSVISHSKNAVIQ